MKNFNEGSWGVIGQSREFSSPSPRFTCGFVLSLPLYGSFLYCLKIRKSHHHLQQTQQSVSEPIHIFPLFKVYSFAEHLHHHETGQQDIYFDQGVYCISEGTHALGFFVLFLFGFFFKLKYKEEPFWN